MKKILNFFNAHFKRKTSHHQGSILVLRVYESLSSEQLRIGMNLRFLEIKIFKIWNGVNFNISMPNVLSLLIKHSSFAVLLCWKQNCGKTIGSPFLIFTKWNTARHAVISWEKCLNVFNFDLKWKSSQFQSNQLI